MNEIYKLKEMHEFRNSNEEFRIIINNIVDEVNSQSTTILSLIEATEFWLTSSDEQHRASGISIISKVIVNTRVELITLQTIEVLMQFLVSRLEDRSSVDDIITTLHHLILATTNNDKIINNEFNELIQNVILKIYKDLHGQSLVQPTRFTILQLTQSILSLILLRNNSDDSKSNDFESEFIAGFVKSIDGEKDPRNLLLIFNLSLPILTSTISSTLKLSLFSNLFSYFPISFTPPLNDPYGITPADLKDSLRSIICADSLFSALAIPVLMHHLENGGSGSGKVDAINTIALSLSTYPISSYIMYFDQIWDSLKVEISRPSPINSSIQGSNESQTSSLKCLFELCKSASKSVTLVTPPSSNKSLIIPVTDKPSVLEGLINLITKDCLQSISKSDATTIVCGKILMTIASSSLSAYILTIQRMSILIGLIGRVEGKSVNNEVRGVIGVVVDLLIATKLIAISLNTDDIIDTGSIANIDTTLNTSTDTNKSIDVSKDTKMSIDAINNTRTSAGPRLIEESVLDEIVTQLTKGLETSDAELTKISIAGVHALLTTPHILSPLQSNYLLTSMTAVIKFGMNDGVYADIQGTGGDDTISTHYFDVFVSFLCGPEVQRALMGLDVCAINPQFFGRVLQALFDALSYHSSRGINSADGDVQVSDSVGGSVCVSGSVDSRNLANVGVAENDALVSSQAILGSLEKILTRRANMGDREKLIPSSIHLIHHCFAQPGMIEFIISDGQMLESFSPILGIFVQTLDPHSQIGVAKMLFKFNNSPSDIPRDCRLVVLYRAVILNLWPNTLKSVIKNLPAFVTKFVDAAIASDDKSFRYSTGCILASIMNKTELNENISSILGEFKSKFMYDTSYKMVNEIVIEMYAWISKGLICKAHFLGNSNLEELIGLLNNERLALVSSQSIDIILRPGILTKQSHAIINRLSLQKFYDFVSEKLIDKFGGLREEMRKYGLIALSSLLRLQNKNILRGIERVLPLLVSSLEISDHDLRLSTLNTLMTIEPKILVDDLSVIDRLLEICCGRDDMEVRILTFKVLGIFPGALGVERLGMYRSRVIAALGVGLNDWKRAVRRECGNTRSKWYLIAAS